MVMPLHEIGHALGLYHTQQRNDRDEHIRVLEDRITPQYIHGFKKMPNSLVYDVPYDMTSMMHYSAYQDGVCIHVVSIKKCHYYY